MNQFSIGISETIRDHLTQQKAQAGVPRSPREHAPMQCMYRDPKGNSCAVGCLIPDAQYSDGFEGEALNGNVNAQDLRRLLLDLYPGVDVSLLIKWQGYHDGEQYRLWCEDPERGVSPGAFHLSVTTNL